MSKCIAKRTIKVTNTELPCESTWFWKGETYQCTSRTKDIVVYDKYGTGVIYDMNSFDKEFELVS